MKAARDKLRPRHIDLIALGVCLAVALPFCFAKINPLLRPRSAAADQESRLAALQRNVRAMEASLAGQRKGLAELTDALSRERLDLQPARHVNARIARLTDLAAGCALEVDEIVPGQATGGARCDMVPIRLRGNGMYPTCAAFLGRLAGTMPDVSVVSFELAGDAKKPGKSAAFTVNLIWYAAVEAAAPTN